MLTLLSGKGPVIPPMEPGRTRALSSDSQATEVDDSRSGLGCE